MAHGNKPKVDTEIQILFDAHMLGEKEAGNETYAAGLIEGFRSLDLPGSYRFTALCGPNHLLKKQVDGQVSYAQLRRGSNWKRVFRTIPQYCRQIKADLVHVTYNGPPLLSCPIVVSVHDVIFRLYPQYFSPRVRALLSTLLPLTLIRAEKIITLSETSKKDIEAYYPFAKGKVVVIPIAAGPLVDSPPDYEGIKSLIDGDFILSVGTLQPRKNILRLIDAYIGAREQNQLNAKLLIVGRAAWHHSELIRKARYSSYGRDIIFTGYISDTLLSALYRRCKLFVYPSIYEGFGLPVIEAMACGAPVVTSNSSSVPEVAGDAAILVDPHSVDSIQDALVRVMSNEELQNVLRRRGEANAKRFSWQKTAAMTLDVYRDTLHNCS